MTRDILSEFCLYVQPIKFESKLQRRGCRGSEVMVILKKRWVVQKV